MSSENLSIAQEFVSIESAFYLKRSCSARACDRAIIKLEKITFNAFLSKKHFLVFEVPRLGFHFVHTNNVENILCYRW